MVELLVGQVATLAEQIAVTLARDAGRRRNKILLSLDVSSLYTNIPNEEGTMAALRALPQARPGYTQPSNLSLVEMLAQVLSYNNFQFDGKNYLQVGGTAMGNRVALSYANIFMNDFEDMSTLITYSPWLGIITLTTSFASGNMGRKN